VQIDLKNVDASWYDINHSQSPTVVHDKVFMISLLHRASSSGYVVAYASSPEEAANIATHRSWKVLRNDRVCQAVQFNDGTLMTAMYKEGAIKISSTISVRVSRPCLLLVKGMKIFVSDPNHKGGSFSVAINGIQYGGDITADGTTMEFSMIVE
jgi:chondroitin AC lyase